jgi:hypothetical protein
MLLTLVFTALLLQGILTVLTQRSFYVSDPTIQLEVVFFIIGLINFKPTNISHFLLSACLLISAIVCILISKNLGTPIYDSLRAVKWIIYLAVIWSTSQSRDLRLIFVIRLYKLIISSAALCYTIQVAREGINTRPVLFTENNFEITFFAGIFILIFTYCQQNNIALNLRWYLILMFVIALSGSRSGVITGILVTLVVIRVPFAVAEKKFIRIFLLMSVLSIALFTFLNRGSLLAKTDRYSFFTVFLSETRTRSIFKWGFGNYTIEPLSNSACTTLNYYQLLVTDYIYGTCFSVILHSFVLRVLWDFGFAGLLLSFLAIYFRINAVLPKPLPQILTLLAFINALSVSGPNNVYVIFPILLAIITKQHISLKQSPY